MAETNKETVITYFEDNVTKLDAVKIAKEMGLDPSKVSRYPLGGSFVYGIEIECESGFKSKYQSEYVNPRSTENRHEIRAQRCDIPGLRKRLIKCPEDRKCEGCPYRDSKPTMISIQRSAETYGYDIFGVVNEMSVEQQIELKEAISQAVKEKPNEVTAFLMDIEGFSKKEIQKEFDVSEATVYRWIESAAKLLREIWLSN